MIVSAKEKINIIPRPVSVTEKDGSFTLNNKTEVFVAGDKELFNTIQFFTKKIQSATGIDLKTKNVVPKTLPASSIVVQIAKTYDKTLQEEGYSLKISPLKIEITANKPQGIFYGMQSLLQLMPADVESIELKSLSQVPVPCVDITDYPRFGWRGMMLDVSRHFFTKEEVKQYIDEMVKYKYNTLHLHLTDDNGWRVEIKSIPELTQKGSMRVPRYGRWGKFQSPQPDEKPTYGGFYTQDAIRELIHYAADRYVTILPEVDIPAHSLAMISAFPGLSCTQLQYPVNPGSDFYTKEDNALCIGNDSVFLMLDKIFTELAQLFPNPYIHVGGDEAYKGFWEKCPKCQKRMADEHLKNVDELQSYFIKRMEKMLLSKNKKLIGWDEILEGGLAPEATVMSWRGMKGGIEAAKMNHHVVMTPYDHCYIDLYQGEPTNEPATYSMCRLSDSYNWDPVPEDVDEKFILGGQANLWTESVPNFRHAQYMTWPRSLALAEVYWSPKNQKDWNNFVDRVEAQLPRLDKSGTKYATSFYNAIVKPVKADNSEALAVTLSSELSGTEIYYTFDGTDPDNHSPKYKGEPLSFWKGADEIRVIVYKNNQPIGKQVNLKLDELKKRLK